MFFRTGQYFLIRFFNNRTAGISTPTGKSNFEMLSTDVNDSKIHGKLGTLDSKDANRFSAKIEQLS